jgi:hypothetical protein
MHVPVSVGLHHAGNGSFSALYRLLLEGLREVSDAGKAIYSSLGEGMQQDGINAG